MRVLEQNDPPVITAVEPGSAAERAGLKPGDRILEVGGLVPRDIIEWHVAMDDSDVELILERDAREQSVQIRRNQNEPAGVQIASAVFDRVKTCDNHCDFCFIYQLPKGLRSSLYLKDDDYRLSFLYGNFTTLTRFTESDLERVISERISPLNVSVHTCDPTLRASMLRNERGAVSLRWLRELLKGGIEVRAQVVLCPGVNDRIHLDRTLATALDRYADLVSIAVVPLGLSKHNPESHLRVQTKEEARDVIRQIDSWREIFTKALGRPLVYAADEFYLVAEIDFPPSSYYGDFEMYEDGIGMMRQLEGEYQGLTTGPNESPAAFFQDSDIPHRYGDGYALNPAGETGLRRSPSRVDESDFELTKKRVILTGEYGEQVLRRLIGGGHPDVEIVAVANQFFGGNTAVTGLMTGEDINRVLADVEEGAQIFLPDVCLSNGRFLDGMTVAQLVRDIHVVPTDGRALRRIVEG